MDRGRIVPRPKTPPATRRQGAHFLTADGVAVKRIVAAAAIGPGECVVDIGAGEGAITRHLCDAVGEGGQVVAIETNAARAAVLAGLGRANLVVVTGDALQVALPPKLDAVVANPPYRIIPALLRRLLDRGFGRAVLVMPQELAERLAATPKSAAYGRLTVEIALRAKTRILFSLRRSDFEPPPEVQSRVVLVTPKAMPADIEAAVLEAVLDAAWTAKRKTLRHSLAPLAAALGVPPVAVTEALAACKAGARTAVEVSPWEYGRIAAALSRTS